MWSPAVVEGYTASVHIQFKAIVIEPGTQFLSLALPLLVHYDLGYIKTVKDNDLFLILNTLRSYAVEVVEMCRKLTVYL